MREFIKYALLVINMVSLAIGLVVVLFFSIANFLVMLKETIC